MLKTESSPLTQKVCSRPQLHLQTLHTEVTRDGERHVFQIYVHNHAPVAYTVSRRLFRTALHKYVV